MGIKRRRGTNSAAQDGNTTSKDADTTSQGVTPWMFWGVAVVAVVLAVSGSTTLLPTHPSRQQAATQPPSVKVSANARPGNKMRQYKDPVPHTVESVLFSAPTRYGTLQTVEAFVVHDFLPIDLATRWRDALLKGGLIIPSHTSHSLFASSATPLHFSLCFFLSIKNQFIFVDSNCTLIHTYTFPCASSTLCRVGSARPRRFWLIVQMGLHVKQ